MLMFEEKYFALSPNLKLWVHICFNDLMQVVIILQFFSGHTIRLTIKVKKHLLLSVQSCTGTLVRQSSTYTSL